MQTNSKTQGNEKLFLATVSVYMYIKMAIIFNFLNQDEIANFDCQIWKLQNSLKNNKE